MARVNFDLQPGRAMQGGLMGNEDNAVKDSAEAKMRAARDDMTQRPTIGTLASAQPPREGPPDTEDGQLGDHAMEQGEHEAVLEPQVQAHLGRKLREVYQSLVDQPVPDRFIQLLRELDRKREKEQEEEEG
jgi:Anti-sigma factor NepR